jgi:hypothetical protein
MKAPGMPNYVNGNKITNALSQLLSEEIASNPRFKSSLSGLEKEADAEVAEIEQPK